MGAGFNYITKQSSIDSPTALLEQVAARVDMIEEPNQQRNISACVEVLARLKFDENLIRRFLREDLMRESPLYQEILQEGVQQGIQQGIQQGEVTLTLRLLTRRLGSVPPQLRSLASAAFNNSSRSSR